MSTHSKETNRKVPGRPPISLSSVDNPAAPAVVRSPAVPSIEMEIMRSPTELVRSPTEAIRSPLEDWDLPPRMSIPNTSRMRKYTMDRPPPDEPEKPDIFNLALEEFVKRARREGESDDEVRRKVLLLPPCVLMLVFFTVFLIYQLVSHQESGPIRIVLASTTCFILFFVCFVAFRYRIMSMRIVERSVVILLVCALISDLVNVGLYEQWFIAILLMNALLLTEPEPRLSWSLFGLTMLWIVVRSVEDTIRFGLYDDIPYNDNKKPRPAEGWRWGISILVLRVGVFSLDHALTRRFAYGMKRERLALQESVQMAERIAEALVRFDLDFAEELVTTNHNVAMRGSFERLLANLRMYRPYLPATVFHTEEEDAFLPRKSQNPQNADIPGLVISVDNPNSHDSPRERRTVQQDEDILRQRLEVGMRIRRGSLVRAVFEASTAPLQECFEIAAAFAETLLKDVSSWGGIVVDLNGPVAYCAWNTHLPCPRHGYHASKCTLSLSRNLLSGSPWLSLCAASGNLAIGSTGLDWQRSPMVYGTPLCQVDALTSLSREIQCRILITEAVYEAVRTQVAARLVDVIPEHPLVACNDNQSVSLQRDVSCFQLGSDTIGVYELMDALPHHLHLYSDAFIALRGNKGEYAVSLFTKYLSRSPDDYQAARLLKLAAACKESTTFLPMPYVRDLIGWRNYEERADALLPEDMDVFIKGCLAKGLTESMSRPSVPMTPIKTPLLSSSKADDLITQLRKVSTRNPSTARKDRESVRSITHTAKERRSRDEQSKDDGKLRESIPSLVTSESDQWDGCSRRSTIEPSGKSEARSSMHSSGDHSGAASYTSEKALVDVDGSKWYKSDKMLGNGAYGEVWLGMGEDGALVAMKWLRAVIPALDIITEKSGPVVTDPDGIDSDSEEEDSGDEIPTASVDHMVSPPATDTILSDGVVHAVDTRPSLDTFTEDPYEDNCLVAGGEVNESVLQEIKKEVELLSHLHHDNIVSYVSLAVTEECIVINMEYVPGGSLQNILEQFGKLPMSSIRRYLKDIVKGLRYLHKMNVAHRDFKPANVLVQIDGQCKLSDFGASTIMGDVVGKKVVGTLIYMSPEACRGEAAICSDIWSVGVATSQMITSSLPFPERLLSEPAAFLYQMAMAQTSALPQVPEHLSPDAAHFIRACLTVDIHTRPTAEELIRTPFLTF